MGSKFSITAMKQNKLSADAALEQVKRFCFEYDIDVDSIDDRKQKRNMENILGILLEYVQRGLVEFLDDGNIRQHIGSGVEPITYKRITGAQKLAMDGYEETQRYAMMYAVLGAASGLGEDAIKKLSGTNLKVAEALALAFL